MEESLAIDNEHDGNKNKSRSCGWNGRQLQLQLQGINYIQGLDGQDNDHHAMRTQIESPIRIPTINEMLKAPLEWLGDL